MFKNNKRNFIIILIIAFIVMVFSFKNDYQNIIKMFSNLNAFWIVISVIFVSLSHLFDAYFNYYYCKFYNKDYKFYMGLQAQQAGVFFNSITPANSGGNFAQIVVYNKQNINTKLSASMLMMSFISWQIVLVIFGATVLIFNYARVAAMYSGFFSIVFIGFSINLVVIVTLFLAAFSKKFHKFLINTLIPIGHKLRIVKDVEEEKKRTGAWLRVFREEFNNILVHKKIMFMRLLTDIFKIFALYSIPFFAARSLNLELGLADLGNIIILTSFVYMIVSFVPVPGGAGGTEATFVLLLNPAFGAATTSVMLLWRVLTYYLPMVVSFFVFANIKELTQSDRAMEKEETEEELENAEEKE